MLNVNEMEAEETLIHGCWKCKLPSPFGKHLALSAKGEHACILWPNNFTYKYTSNRNSCPYVHKDVYKNIHSTIIHNRMNCPLIVKQNNKQSTVHK